MRRREFLGVLGGAAAWPQVSRGQQSNRVYRLGWLIAFPENSPLAREIISAATQMLRGLGWIEGKNLQIDYRFAAGDPALFTSLAAELVSRSPDAMLATTTPAAAALRTLTRTIPIVFVVVPDPIGVGFVQSFPRPGGNMTGFISFDPPIIGKWVQLLKEAAPGITRVAAIFNPNTGFSPSYFTREIEMASSFGVKATLAPVQDRAGVEDTIAAQAREPGGGLMILPDSFNVRHRDVIVEAANRQKVPLIGFDIFARAGGLMSYWFDTADQHAQAASYVDRIFKGERASELPVQTPTRYRLMINLKTAKTMGIEVPPTLLARADEVIE
jgi:putative tryptophan/tyrosine transport system substrate-binding protein